MVAKQARVCQHGKYRPLLQRHQYNLKRNLKKKAIPWRLDLKTYSLFPDGEESERSCPTSLVSTLDSEASSSSAGESLFPDERKCDINLEENISLCSTGMGLILETADADSLYGAVEEDDSSDSWSTCDSFPLLLRRPRKPILASFDLAGVAKYIKERPGCRILVLTGAGISVAAGIPDFRSPGTGLYSRLEQYRLPMPSAIFDLDYFPHRPEPFYTLAKELWPGNYAPTLVHVFITLLYEKGLLLRSYTQNIDGLELVAGLPQHALVEVHGTFASARCLACRRRHLSANVKEAVFNDRIPRCECGGLIKPDIVFFGEQLPERFFQMARHDFREAELVITIGTSLQVAPFSSLPGQCDADVPRLLINNEVVGEVGPCRPDGFDFSEYNYRDAKMIGDCQQGALDLAALLGWKYELLERYQQAQKVHGNEPVMPALFQKPAWLTEQEGIDLPTDSHSD